VADFSTILQSPDIRAIVQDGFLERAFHDGLFPKMLFRGEATPVLWPAHAGDSAIFTGVAPVKKKMKPIVPGQDPGASDYQKEQWTAVLQTYGDSIPTHMPSSLVAIASLFLRNAQQLGLGAARTLNSHVRNRLYNAGQSGWTVADGAQVAVTVLRVKRLNGFTTARQTGANATVRYDLVSAANPLAVLIFNTGTGLEQSVNVIGFTADNSGDQTGPGTITVDAAVTVSNRDYVISVDRTFLVRVGGGNKVDSITSASLLKLADLRSGVSRLQQENVPEHPDGYFHCHLDPTSQAQVFNDAEWQRLLTSMPDGFQYKSLAIGQLLGAVYFRNSECPQIETIDPNDGVTFSLDDNFAGELTANGLASGVKVHRPLFTAQGGIMEYYQDLGALITDAGINGKVGQFQITNNGIEVMSDRVQLIIRAPLNKFQDTVDTTYKFQGDWPVRTDSTTGDAARYKRQLVIEHGA